MVNQCRYLPDRRYKNVYLFRGLWSACSHLFAEGVARETERTRWCHRGFGPSVLLKLTGEKLPRLLSQARLPSRLIIGHHGCQYLTRTCITNAALFLLSWSQRFFLIHEIAAKWRTRVAFSRLSHAKKNKEKPLGLGYISTIRPSVLYNPSRKRILSERSEEFENTAFYCGRNAYGTFRKRRAHDNHVISMYERVKSKMTGDCYVFNFPPRSVNVKYLIRFQSENSVFKFLLLNVDVAWKVNHLLPRAGDDWHFSLNCWWGFSWLG